MSLPLHYGLWVLSLLFVSSATLAEQPETVLTERFQRIDAEMPGRLGIYVRHLEEGWEVGHHADRDWYLASTIKIPLGIVLLQGVEQGEWALADELVLAESDFVDGTGSLLWEQPGTAFSLGELNRRSISDSDSTATDMLIRHIDEAALNAAVQELPGGAGFGPITTILAVRQQAWSEVHERAAGLSNRDFIALNAERNAARRHAMVLEKLGLESTDADAQSTREAFQRFYASGMNGGSLVEFGTMLEALVRGELLDDEHTALLIEAMENLSTGDTRIRSGLPEGVSFAHKTGTQIDRACDIGVLEARQPERAVIVAVCAEDYDELAQAEKAFAAVGRALGDVLTRESR